MLGLIFFFCILMQAENTDALVKLTNKWKKKYGSIPADLQVRACDETLPLKCLRSSFDMMSITG